MSDYIRKEDVLNLPQSIERNLCGEIVERSIDVKDIESLEPADVVPVVRCKDCENWQTDWNPSIPDRHYCAVMDSMMKADDFCSYGERKDGDGNG